MNTGEVSSVDWELLRQPPKYKSSLSENNILIYTEEEFRRYLEETKIRNDDGTRD